jgi:hypothetical protein
MSNISWWIFDEKHHYDIIDELNDEKQSDRSVSLIAASFLESRLQIAIESRLTDRPKLPRTKPSKSKDGEKGNSLFNRLFGGHGSSPLGTFSAKIDMALAIGLFGLKVYHDLTIIREIRNTFAHEMKRITFNTRSIRDMCNNLWIPKHISLPVGDPRIDPPKLATEPREQYLHTVNAINGGLYTEMVRQPAEKAKPVMIGWD